MIVSNAQIGPGSITDGKVSNQAKIKVGKLQKVSAGQLLVGGSDGKLAPVSISGDVAIDANGVATVGASSTSTVTTVPMTAEEIKSTLGVQGNVVDTLSSQTILAKTMSGGSF